MAIEDEEFEGFAVDLVSNEMVRSIAAAHRVEVSEILSEMSMVISRRRHLVRMLSSHSSYLARMAINSARSINRRKRRHSLRCVPLDQVKVDPIETRFFVNDIELRETTRLCREAILSLPLKYRDAVEACYLSGVSMSEYARSRGLKYSSVAVRLRRARSRLRECQVLIKHCT